MKIYNFNHPFSPRQASWYCKTYQNYIKDLFNKVQSLYEFIINFNAPFHIINYMNNPDNIENIFTDSIVNGYYGVIDNIDHTPTLLGYNLNWRQGVINTSNDGQIQVNISSTPTFIPWPMGYVCVCNTNKDATSRMKEDYYLIPVSLPSFYKYTYADFSLLSKFSNNQYDSSANAVLLNFGKYNKRFIYNEVVDNRYQSYTLTSTNITDWSDLYWLNEPIQLYTYHTTTNSNITTIEEYVMDYNHYTIEQPINNTLQYQTIVNFANPIVSQNIHLLII